MRAPFPLARGHTHTEQHGLTCRNGVLMHTQAKAMVKSLLIADLSKRLQKPEDIRMHNWFDGIDFDAVYERRLIPPHVPRIGEEGDSHYFDEYPDDKDTPDKNDVDQSLFAGF